jgi:hypothetical protein
MHHSSKENLITTKSAGEIFGYTSDYIARLARAGKIVGERVGNTWLVDKDSIALFLEKSNEKKSSRAQALSREREVEYRTHHSRIHRTKSTLTQIFSVVERAPHIDVMKNVVRSQFLASSVAIAVIMMGAVGARAEILPQATHVANILAQNVAVGFTTTFGDIPSHITKKIIAVQGIMQYDDTYTVLAPLQDIYKTTPRLAEVNPTLLNTIFAQNYETPHTASVARVTSETSLAPVAVLTTVQSVVRSLSVFFTTKHNVGVMLLGGYRALGDVTYVGITKIFTAYESLTRLSGEKALALGSGSRDTLAHTPTAIMTAHIALGKMIIALTHTAIQADVSLAYTTATVAPESARITFNFVSGIGDRLARITEQVPTRIAQVYLETTAIPAVVAPHIAESIFNVTYIGATHFVGATHLISETYLESIQSVAGATAIGAEGTLAFIKRIRPSITDASSVFQDAYLNVLGHTALAFDTITKTPRIAEMLGRVTTTTGPMLASVQPAFSVGEKVALTTYETIHSFFDSTTSSLAVLFTPTTPITKVVVRPTTTRTKQVAVAPAPSRATTNVSHTTLTSYPTYTTIVKGVSEDTVQQSLASLRADVLATVAGMIQPVATQTATNVTTIQQVNMIQDLSNLIVRNGSFRGGTFDGGSLTNGISVTATTGTFDNLIGGTTQLATTTIVGPLVVNGVLITANGGGGSNGQAAFFTATSTIASTFPYASTTALTVSGVGGLSLGSLDGPLQANGGMVSATSSVGVVYGGTGLTSAPLYGQILLGNATGGYTLTATSSLGIISTSNTWDGTQTFTNLINGSISGNASTVTTNANLTGDVTSLGNATTIGANKVTLGMHAVLAGNSLIGNPTGGLATPTTIATSSLGIALSDTTGTLAIGRGGTGISITPAYGEVLLGNGVGGYTLTATSSLGINSGTWGIISGTLSNQTDLQNALNAKLNLSDWFATTSAPQINTLANLVDATTTSLNIGGSITGAGLIACAGSTNKLLWNAVTKQFTCGVDAGSSGGLTGLGAQYSSYQTGSTQTLATSSDTNIGLTITSSGDIHTFTPTWIGTLGDSRIASAATWNAKQTSALAKGNFLVGNDAGVAQATSSIFVDSVGRVGFGPVSSLGAKVDIVAGIAAQLRLSNTVTDATNKFAYLSARHYTNAQTDTSLLLGINSSASNLVLLGGGSGSLTAATELEFYTATNNTTLAGTQRMTINNLGSVGIGSTTPSSVLSITNTVGTAVNTPLFTIASTTGGLSTTTLMTVLANGNVGIGTTTPAYKLDVGGFINTDQFSGYKQAGNTILWATTSTSSFFAGPFAGNGSLATTTAFGNVGIGAYALYLATSTGTNTAVGYSALRNVSAGPNAWNGVYNTAIGYNTGTNITTGFENTLVGYNAGSSITTGAALTFIGHNVGALNTSGLNNAAMGTLSTGRGALYSNTIGSNNTAIGSGALYFNTNSNSNTALGAYAANGNANYSNTGGVYIGTLAGAQLGTGSNYNTLIGFNAGDAITTGFGNILIGAGVSATSSTATNSLNIGNLLYGIGLYSGSATSSTPTANGMLGIGTTSPFATLSVAGNGFFNDSLTASNITAKSRPSEPIFTVGRVGPPAHPTINNRTIIDTARTTPVTPTPLRCTMPPCAFALSVA